MEAAPPGNLLGQALWYLRRSFELTRGHYWRLLGWIFLYMLAVGFFQNGIFRTISTIAELFTMGSAFKDGFEGAITQMSAQPPAGSMIVSLVLFGAVALFFPALQIAYLTLLYLDLRIRKEGLDLELALGTARVDA